MTSLARLFLLPAAVLALAVPASAGTLSIPRDGTVPAVSIDEPDGWSENYDEYGNLVVFTPDKSGFLLFRMIAAGPGETVPSDAEMAKIILESAHAKPYSKVVPARFAGGPATDFVSTLTVDNGPTFNLHVVLRHVDATHIAVGALSVLDGATADQQAQLDTVWRSARITGR